MIKKATKIKNFHLYGCVSQKLLKSRKIKKNRFKKFQVKNHHFTAKTTLKGPKKGSQGDTLRKHKKRAFRRGQKTTFFAKTHRYKGKHEKKHLFKK